MKKVITFFEGYAQWLALGVAVLWLGYVGYTYWYKAPVAVEASSLTPATVDPHVLEVSNRLLRDMEDPGTQVHGYGVVNANFPEKLAMQDVPPVVLGSFFGAQHLGPIDMGPKQAVATADRATLPVLDDVLTMRGVSSGMSQVVLPAPDAQPGQPPPLNVNGQTAGIIWTTTSAEFNQKAFAAAWAKAKLPPIFQTTEFMRVQLVRQELVDDQWTDQQVIKELPVHPLKPWPPAPPDQKDYEDWAATSPADIVEPAFYEVIAGVASDPWHTVNMQIVTAPVVQQREIAYDPATMKPRTPEEQKLKDAYDKQKADQERQARLAKRQQWMQQHPTPPADSGGGGAPPSRGGKSYLPISVAENDGPVSPRVPPRPLFRGRPMEAPSANPNVPMQPGQPIPAPEPNKTLPTAPFNPSQVQDTEVWAHDDTAQSGHTYRYMLKLSMKNPLYGTDNVAKDQADADKYTIEAQTEWSAPVTVPVNSHYYIVNNGGFNQVVQVEIFTWDKGQWTSKVVRVQPGDSIPGTGCAVVDTRKDYFRDQIRVLVRDDHGAVLSRTDKGDQADPDYKRLSDLVKAAQPPPAANAGGV